MEWLVLWLPPYSKKTRWHAGEVIAFIEGRGGDSARRVRVVRGCGELWAGFDLQFTHHSDGEVARKFGRLKVFVLGHENEGEVAARTPMLGDSPDSGSV